LVNTPVRGNKVSRKYQTEIRAHTKGKESFDRIPVPGLDQVAQKKGGLGGDRERPRAQQMKKTAYSGMGEASTQKEGKKVGG